MRLLVCSAAALVVMASVACGSKSSDEGTTEEASTSIPRTDPTPTPSDPAATPAAPSEPASTADAGSGEGGGGGDGGGGGLGDGGGGGAPNAQCAPASVHETEANDSPDTANALPNATSSFCGTLASTADVDFVSFVLPADTKNIGFGAAYSAQGLAIEGTAGGQTFAIGNTPAFKPGQKYVFKIHTTGGGPVDYRFDVTIGK